MAWFNLFTGDTMRERINRLAKGIVDAEILTLSIAPEMIQETVRADEVIRKEFYVTDQQGRFVKGLVYSSNMRVRVLNNAFGGNRNRISYEVDSRHLSKDDVIEGAFYLVTNGGEKKLPYSFSIELGLYSKTLAELKAPSDFAELAKRDWELALRLFEYQEFVGAPFMQDLHIRALYDGLKGRLNRSNQMEEFLVGMKAKEQVRLKADHSPRHDLSLPDAAFGALEVHASTWGYVRFEVKVDGDFLELSEKVFDSQNFQDGICLIPYQVNLARLHKGKNLGALIVSTVHRQISVPIEVQAGGEEADHSVLDNKKALGKYLALRLDYELGIYEDRLLINKMKQILEQMRRQSGGNIMLALRQAELYLLEGQKERAAVLLDGCKAEGMNLRVNQKDSYYIYQYLLLQVHKKEGQRENLLRLVKKCLSEDPGNIRLYLLRLKLEPSVLDNPAQRLEEMGAMFAAGCHSPYLYTQAFKLYAKTPQLLTGMGEFEVQVMGFAARHELVEHELALKIAALSSSAKHYNNLYRRLLAALYEKYHDKELLSAVCGMMIKGNRRGVEDFPWYQKALEEEVGLTRLYEYYLYSLPRDYPYLLPKKVLLYFSYEKSLDDYSRSLLYMNILKFMNPEAPLYKQYEREIQRFTMEQLLKSRINRRFVVLYQHMLYKEMIDIEVAKVLPSLLKSYRVRLNNPNIRYVVVCYEEMEGEDAFPVKDGAAYVPIFTNHPVLLFQDGYGNRYANIPHIKQPAMEHKNIQELEERCYEIYPNHPMLRLKECGEIVSAGIAGNDDLQILKRANGDLRLHPLFKSRVLVCMIEYYRKHVEDQESSVGIDVNYLMSLNLERMSRDERVGVYETLICQDYMREVYEAVKRYGYEGISSKLLLKLCAHMILKGLFGEDELLLSIGWRLFQEGNYDSVLLDYLCEHFNGSTRQMYKVLSQGVRVRVELYDMPERLLAQMMFTGETECMDQVFDWYAAGKKTGNMVIKAYFTMKTSDYFRRTMPTADRVFSYLESMIRGAADWSRVPTIYLLALTKYYSTLEVLDEERKGLCSSMVKQLLAEGRVFAHFRHLSRLIPMPDFVTDKVIVEYRGSMDATPELSVRILPDDKEYSCAKLSKVYPGIYVYQAVLFEGEVLEYRISSKGDGERRLLEEGKLSCDFAENKKEGSRFEAINEMGLCLTSKNEQELKAKMKKYLIDSIVAEELFTLM